MSPVFPLIFLSFWEKNKNAHTCTHSLLPTTLSVCLSHCHHAVFSLPTGHFWGNSTLDLDGPSASLSSLSCCPNWFLKPNLNPVSLGKSCCLGTTSPTSSSFCLPFLLSYEIVERANCSQSIHIFEFLRQWVFIHHSPGVAYCHQVSLYRALSFLLLCGLQ